MPEKVVTKPCPPSAAYASNVLIIFLFCGSISSMVRLVKWLNHFYHIASHIERSENCSATWRAPAVVLSDFAWRAVSEKVQFIIDHTGQLYNAILLPTWCHGPDSQALEPGHDTDDKPNARMNWIQTEEHYCKDHDPRRMISNRGPNTVWRSQPLVKKNRGSGTDSKLDLLIWCYEKDPSVML